MAALIKDMRSTVDGQGSYRQLMDRGAILGEIIYFLKEALPAQLGLKPYAVTPTQYWQVRRVEFVADYTCEFDKGLF